MIALRIFRVACIYVCVCNFCLLFGFLTCLKGASRCAGAALGSSQQVEYPTRETRHAARNAEVDLVAAFDEMKNPIKINAAF
jgi:hypothetical protein